MNTLLKKLLPAFGLGLMMLSAAPALADEDTTNPTVSNIAPLTARADAPTNMTANFSDNIGVTNCNLLVNGGLQGAMTVTGSQNGTATMSYAFDVVADYYIVEVECFDEAGNRGVTSVHVTVADNHYMETPPTGYQDRLVKLRCPANIPSDPNHPCKAVYFIGRDNKRHAFPNEHVFFTWYSNFGGVVELDSAGLAAIQLGTNVTYRPGTRLVKFMSIDKVYAVGRYGTLRWIKTEAAAQALYGNDWNHKVDDVDETFYTNYRFGTDINAAADFSPSAETSAVTNFSMDY